MKYLLDECITIHDSDYYVTGVKNIRSVQALGEGVKDSQILKYAKENKMVLVTADKKFVVNSLAEGVSVVYKCSHTGKELFLKPRKFDRITTYLKRKSDVIRP
jgi:rRNA-processing protein FCF1